MYKNYFLFKAQTIWLRDKIKDFEISECFTYQKFELVLKIYSIENLFLRICIDPSHPYIFLSKARNIKDSKYILFKDLTGQKINNISIENYDKIVILKTGHYQLISIFYGRSPNIILKNLENIEIERFKKKHINQIQTKSLIKIFPDKLQLNDVKELIQINTDLNVIDFLSRHICGFNFVLARECCFRSQIDFNYIVKFLSQNQLANLVENILQIVSEINNPSAIIYYDNGNPKHLTISKLIYLEKDYKPKSYLTINEAWKIFLRESIESFNIEKIVKQYQSVLIKRIDYLKSSFKKVKEFEKLEERKILSELKGNLLLTFLNSIPRGSKSVKLENIFSKDKETVQIKLNPAKSIQENARKYFEKFKDIDTQKERIKNRKSALTNELELLLDIQDKYLNITTQRDVLKFKKILLQKNILQNAKDDEIITEIFEHKFRKIVLLNKWKVYIGKSNVNNDLLTFKFANKFDLWFHAQNVSGSHTIIHLKNRNEIPPMNIIENVASLAAFHSSAKHSGSVSVIYTQVRYVRRIKKANPGTVNVLQYKTIFVEPKNL
jgi:predicted ribosome quality control (RQC) complex YloA/Tae2 family protein